MKYILRLFLTGLGIIVTVGLLTSPWSLWGQPEPDKSVPLRLGESTD